MRAVLGVQVVVQVNGCDTPTLGAVVDAVSAQASQPLLRATVTYTPRTERMHGLSRCRL